MIPEPADRPDDALYWDAEWGMWVVPEKHTWTVAHCGYDECEVESDHSGHRQCPAEGIALGDDCPGSVKMRELVKRGYGKQDLISHMVKHGCQPPKKREIRPEAARIIEEAMAVVREAMDG